MRFPPARLDLVARAMTTSYLLAAATVADLKADAADVLWTIATAHALVRAMGEDDVQGIIAEAFVSLTQDIAA